MKKGVYTEFETEKLLSKYVKVAKRVMVKTWFECEKASRKVRFPLVLKIISKDALHKSDIGGVVIVKNKLELEDSFNSLIKIVKKKKMKLEGVMVQEFVDGNFVLIGLKKDAVFGHAVALGAGGIYTEYLKDVTFRVCPITLKDATEMVNDLKLKDLLLGARGKSGNVEALKKALVAVSKLPLKYPNIKELDINPFVLGPKSGKVVDARMVLE
jgi:succinyl-CoA synthetase beta subunit